MREREREGGRGREGKGGTHWLLALSRYGRAQECGSTLDHLPPRALRTDTVCTHTHTHTRARAHTHTHTHREREREREAHRHRGTEAHRGTHPRSGSAGTLAPSAPQSLETSPLRHKDFVSAAQSNECEGEKCTAPGASWSPSAGCSGEVARRLSTPVCTLQSQHRH